MSETIDNPILNSPYDQPDRYYEIGPNGPTGVIREGRRPSESLIPIAFTKKGKRGTDDSEQIQFDFDATGERRERNTLINDLRRDLAKWRRGGEVRRRHPNLTQSFYSTGPTQIGKTGCCSANGKPLRPRSS
jgi:type III restriction enzyme